jgi:hypothetical protein
VTPIAGDGRIPDADLSIGFLALDPRQAVLRRDAAWSFLCTARDGGAVVKPRPNADVSLTTRQATVATLQSANTP